MSQTPTAKQLCSQPRVLVKTHCEKEQEVAGEGIIGSAFLGYMFLFWLLEISTMQYSPRAGMRLRNRHEL